MEKRLILLGALGLALAAVPGRAQGTSGQIELEGYLFTVRDLPGALTGDLEGLPEFELRGPGLRIHGWVGPSGRADRVEAVYQRVSDDAHSEQIDEWASRKLDLEDAATSLDVLWSHALVEGSGSSALRSQVGYRYLHRQRSAAGSIDEPHAYDCCSGSTQMGATVDGHGLRLGLEVGHDLGRHLRFEATGGAALTAAKDVTTYVSQYIYIGGVMREEATAETKRGLATWDLAARLRGTWGPASLTVGYRFDRWELSDEPLSFDGLTVGLAYRFGSQGARRSAGAGRPLPSVGASGTR